MDPHAVISYVAHRQIAKYFEVAGLALWVFDYCLTFQSEVRWVLGRKWDFVRLLFTLARYVPPVGIIMTVYDAIMYPTITENCDKAVLYGYASDAVHVIGFIFTEGLLVLRTYAFLGRSKKALIWLLLLAAVFLAGSLAATYLADIPSPALDLPVNIGKCVSPENRAYVVQYGCFVVYECVLLSLTVYKMVTHYKNTKNALILTIYRDSIMYISFIILLTLGNTILIATYPDPAIDTLYSLQLVLQGVFAPRLLFNLRETDSRNNASTLVPLTTIGFQKVPSPTTLVGTDVGVAGPSVVHDATSSIK